MKCIYCLKNKQKYDFQKREHVVPQCFGTFSPNNLILYETVCDECNQYFGDKIEIFFGRDSFEGVERLRHGITPKKPLKYRKRVKSIIYEGEWKGTIVVEKIKKDSGKLSLELVVQAGFYNKYKHCYDYFEPNEIPTSDELLKCGYDFKSKMVWMIAEKGKELDSLIEMLNEKGIKVKQNSLDIKSPREGERVLVESNILIDRVIFRGIAKIAFNYSAYVGGKDLLMSSAFDQIRKFIRYDEGKSDHFIAVNAQPILYEDQKLAKHRAKTTQGHLIIVDWKELALYSKVSLFNTATYLVRLCRYFNGIWRPVKAGHHFNMKNRRVEKLSSISKSAIFIPSSL